MGIFNRNDENQDEMQFAMGGPATGGPNPLAPPPPADDELDLPPGPQASPLAAQAKQLAAKQADADTLKGYLGVAGNVLQNFADVPSAHEMLYGGKAHHNNVKGMLDQAAAAVPDPTARQAKLYESYMNAKKMQDAEKENKYTTALDDPNSTQSKAVKAMASRYKIDVDPGSSGSDVLRLFDPKKMNEVSAQSEVDLNKQKAIHGMDQASEMQRLKFGKQADLEKMELGKKLDIEKANAEAPKPDQSQAALFGRRMQQAEDVFGGLEKKGFNRSDIAQGAEAAIMPDAWQSENLRKQDQAERNFVNAVLRKESGAAISKDEFSSAEKQYFPRPGDTPDIRAQKKANRDIAVNGMQVMAGRAWDKLQPLNAPQTEFVNMRAPDGSIRKVPKSKVDSALKAGGSLVDAGSVAGGQ